jgi:murein L,D-transpeptidase YcbB/YkuD
VIAKLFKPSSLSLGLVAAISATGLLMGSLPATAQTSSSPTTTPSSQETPTRRQPARRSNTSPRPRATGSNRTARPNTRSGALRLGSRGETVRKLQMYLKKRGFFKGEVNGIFGPRTREAVIAFQRARGMTPDGVVGVRTLAAML